MKTTVRWFLDNPVAANLLMLTLLVGGVLSLGQLRIESFPQVAPSSLVISVAYPGGTARQVDEGITQRIEEAISDLGGVRRITSQSSEGSSQVTVQKTSSTELERLMEDVRNRVGAIIGFPSQAEIPQVYRNEYTNLASIVVISGPRTDAQLQPIAQQVERALKRHPKIAKVSNWGSRDSQLIIEPEPDQLRRYGLDLSGLAKRIQSASLEGRSGELKSERGRLRLRGDGYADNVQALKQLVIISGPKGQVSLDQLASVRRDYKNTGEIVRNNGNTAIALMVSTGQQDNLLRVSEAITEVLAQQRQQLPDDIELSPMADMAPYISEQLDLLGTNAWQGLLIVLIILGIFLDLKLAFWVALGIPVSVCGTLAAMDVWDYSINDITLFGLILVLGILVDDAVVVGESIYEAQGRIDDPKEAAWQGVEAVTVATVFGILTTVAAFSPMLWIDNELAKVLAGFSAVVIFALLFSLIESKFILPAHLSRYRRLASDRKYQTGVWGQLQAGFYRYFNVLQTRANQGLSYFTAQLYRPLLVSVLNNRVAALLVFGSSVILAYGLWANGSIRSAMFPEIPGRYIEARVTLEDGAPLPLQVRSLNQLESSARQLNRELRDDYDLSQLPLTNLLVSSNGYGSIEATAELTAEALGRLPGNLLLNQWQQRAGEFEGAYAASFSSGEASTGGTAIAVTAVNRELAQRASTDLSQMLARLPGVEDIYDDGQGGMPQVRIRLNDYGRQLGVTQAQLAEVIGGAFGEREVHRLLHKGEETRVVLHYQEAERLSRRQLTQAPVFVEGGKHLALGDVADLIYEREPDVIFRRDRDEVVNIYWRQDRSVQAPEKTWQQLEPQLSKLKRQYPGVVIRAVGEFEEIGELQTGFKTAMILTLLLIYALLAIPLKSYWQPLIIMAVIPFGFAGAIYGHAIMGLPISILSMFGMMAMTGIVVNDSLVLITRFNQYYRGGMPLRDALINSSVNRVRAIFLTTITTVCGLLPLMLETSEQAQYLKPAAVSLVFGELFATSITLLLIPLILSVFSHPLNNKREALIDSSSQVAAKEPSPRF